MHVSQEAEVKRISEELKIAQEERKRQAGVVICLQEEWLRARHERASFEAEVVSQRSKIAELEAERDRDIRHASRAARREVARKYRDILLSLEERWSRKKKEVSAVIQDCEEVARFLMRSKLVGWLWTKRLPV